MPRGVPSLGQNVSNNPNLSSRAEELLSTPGAKDLGTLDLNRVASTVFGEEGPPPWEVNPKLAHLSRSDARRYVEFPEKEWEVRWLNPRLVDQVGLRDWKAIPADHERVRLIVPSLRAPDNTIRRGGHTGDFLAYMPKSWVESRRRLKAQENERRTASAIDRQQATKEAINRGEYGPYVHVDSATHPTHTNADPRTMTDE